MSGYAAEVWARGLATLLAAILCVAAATPCAAVAQSRTITVFDNLVPTAAEPSPRDRIVLLEARLSREPADYELRWRAAEAYAQIGLTEPDSEIQGQLWSRAYDHATAATASEPNGLEGHYWLAVVASLFAEVSGGREKIRMGDQAYRESAWVLEVDSLHAGAHYLQGRIHAAVMRLSSVMRFLAKLLVGGEALDGASWEQAEFHLRRAAELQPELAMHHFELAMTYERMDMPEEMRRALLTAVGASNAAPFQEEYKERARKLLGEP